MLCHVYFQLLIHRNGTDGYGFTVTGSAPTWVCKVESGSAADMAGLSNLDNIVAIDGIDVSSASSKIVAKIIK